MYIVCYVVYIVCHVIYIRNYIQYNIYIYIHYTIYINSIRPYFRIICYANYTSVELKRLKACIVTYKTFMLSVTFIMWREIRL